MKKRILDIVVISDVHLGNPACHAEELLAYLSSIQPKTLVLNGDIIDVWNVKENYFPPSHLNVLRKIISMAAKGTEVYYIVGNRDETMENFIGTGMGNIHIVNKLVLNLDGKRAWFFHGALFDGTLPKAKWFAHLGSFGFSVLKTLKRWCNRVFLKLGREGYALADMSNGEIQKNRVDSALFEATVVDLALDKHYDQVICGHVHLPKKEIIEHRKGTCTYLNSGDWVEHLSALEYSFKRWKLYRYHNDKLSPFYMDEELKEMDIHEIVSNLTDPQDADDQTIPAPYPPQEDTED